MRGARDQAFPAGRAPVGSHHIGGGPGLVDKNQLCRVQPRLLVVPGSPGRGNIAAVPLAGVERLFLCVQPRNCRNRPTAERLTLIPVLVNCACNSSNVASGCADSKARTRSSWAASANFLPPRGAGATLPVGFQRCTSLIAQLSLTANCSAASRQELPASTAATILSRRSSDSARAIHGWPPCPLPPPLARLAGDHVLKWAHPAVAPRSSARRPRRWSRWTAAGSRNAERTWRGPRHRTSIAYAPPRLARRDAHRNISVIIRNAPTRSRADQGAWSGRIVTRPCCWCRAQIGPPADGAAGRCRRHRRCVCSAGQVCLVMAKAFGRAQWADEQNDGESNGPCAHLPCAGEPEAPFCYRNGTQESSAEALAH